MKFIEYLHDKLDSRVILWAGLSYFISQHYRDYLLFKAIQEFLVYVNLFIESSDKVARFRVDNLSTIGEHVIPLFTNHYLHSSKVNYFLDLSKAYLKIKDKSHLTEKGKV